MVRFDRSARLASVVSLVAALTFMTGAAGASPTFTDLSFGPPAGYQVVHGPAVSAIAQTQDHASVACPGTTKPLSGGVLVKGSNTLVNISDSYPDGKSWAVDVDNESISDNTTIRAYAVCADRPSTSFSVRKKGFGAPVGQQTSGSSTCPTGVIMGGGAYTSALDLEANLNSAAPVHTTGWLTDVNNGQTTPIGLTVYAICRKVKPAGYSVQTGTAVANPAGHQTKVVATCPGTSVPVGGGVFSSSTNLDVNINSSIPNGKSWVSYENNASSADAFATPYAICAGT